MANAMNQSQTQMAGTIQLCNAVMNSKGWVIDSGATSHFTYNADMLVYISALENKCLVKLPNGEYLKIQ